MKVRTCVIIICCFLLSNIAWGQATAVSQISGVVRDSSGAAVASAEIRATQTETGLVRPTTSGPDGSYTLPNLPVGPYRLEVSVKGFSSYVQNGILLQVATSPVINVVLQVGAVSEQVEVTANAAMAETHDSSISQVVDQARIENLPLNGRNPTQLVLLSGGAAVPPTPGDLNTSKNYSTQAVTIAVAGGQINDVNYLMDGGDNNSPLTNVNLPFPFPDALQEFSVLTNAVPARYGLHPGGTVNLVTKSGVNQFHGDLFEYLRNGVFNARNFFATARDTLKRSQFGGTFGGPVRHDKLFFFTGYQGTRNRSDPPTTISYVPTQAMLAGDFTALTSSPCSSKPITLAAPFVGNKVSPALFNPQALNFEKFIPVSTDPCGKVQYGVLNDDSEDQVIARVDYNRSEKHTILARYFYSDYRNPPLYDGKNALTTTKVGVADRSQSITVADNYSLTANLLSSFHATGTRLAVNRGSASNFFSPADLGINMSDMVRNTTILNVSNAFNIGCGSCSPAHLMTNTFQVTEDLDLIRGAHQISFGVNWIHDQLNDVTNNYSNAVITINGSVYGTSLADFLLGKTSGFQQGNPQQENQRYTYFGAYAQDNWRVSRRLTVNAGLRWEPYLPEHDIFGRGSHFEMSWFQQNVRSGRFTNAPAGVIFPGDPGAPKGSTSHRLNEWAPRLGLILDPNGDGRQTIRVSYGILYDSPLLINDIRFDTAPPWGNTINLPTPAGGLTNPYQGYPGGNPFPQPFPPANNVAFPTAGVWVNLPLHIHPTYLQQWNLSYQRQMGSDWLVTASYIGNKTTHLWLGKEINPAVYIPGQSTATNTNQRRVLYLMDPVKGAPYATIGEDDDGGNAHYNGLLMSIQHRFSRSFTALGNYTYSHSIGEGDFNNELTGPIYQNPSNRHGDNGNANFDHRHIFNLSLVAQSPKFKDKVLRTVAGGWQMTGLLTAQTGGYWTVTSGVDNSLSGVNLDRPNVVGDWHVANPSPTLWFNPLAFVANGPGQFGNSGRGVVKGPGLFAMDMGLMRFVPVWERLRMEFRAEAFNILNHANFATSSSGMHMALTDAHMGQITQAADPRILQFALKFIF